MKTILYATDFSDNTLNALQYAYQLSVKTGAELIVFHVLDFPTILNSPSKSPTFFDIEKDIEKLTKDKLQYFCEDNLEEHALIENIRYEVDQDPSHVNAIVAMIKKCNADLVVMGTKGESRLYELLIGSTTQDVLEKAECPVLCVPKESPYKTPTNIVYATDFDEDDISVIHELMEIAILFSAKITILHFTIEGEYSAEKKMEHFKEMLQENVNYRKLKFELHVANNIYKQLNEYLVTHNVSIVAMLERKNQNVFDSWFHKDLVERMEYHISVPLLSFNKNYFLKKIGAKKKQKLQLI